MKEKVALFLLCQLLAKKGNDETIVYIYEKCKVSITCTCMQLLYNFRRDCTKSTGLGFRICENRIVFLGTMLDHQ